MSDFENGYPDANGYDNNGYNNNNTCNNDGYNNNTYNNEGGYRSNNTYNNEGGYRSNNTYNNNGSYRNNAYNNEDIYVEAEDVTGRTQGSSADAGDPYREPWDGTDSTYHYSSANMPGSGPVKKNNGGFFKKVGKIVASAAVFGLIAGGVMVGVGVAKNHFFPSNTAQIGVTSASTEASEGSTGTDSSSSKGVTTTDVSSIVDQVMPSVVSITCTVQTSNYFYGTQESEGAGSGFIIAKDDKNLYIATNNHVVSDATSLTVGFCDDSTVSATVVGTDTDADLAVISVKAEDISKDTASKIKVAVLGDSDAIKVGQPVIAIGNALGYGQSVTTGVVSAKDREVSFTDGTMVLLQTDAAINPGNSGGVLVNLNGEVIGINNAKLEDTSVEGMGYAIPMSSAKDILTDLMNATTISEDEAAFLGIVGKDIDSTYSEALGMPSGIYVSQVVSGSPAEKAGISAGDIITGYEGNSVSTMSGLKSKLARKKAGTKVKITYKRANQNGEYEEKTVEVTLGKKSDFADATTQSSDTQQDQSSDQQQNGSGDGSNGSDGYTDPFEYFFGNGNGSDSQNGNGYYYYYNR